MENLIEDLAKLWCSHLENILLQEFPSSKTKFDFSKGAKYWKIFEHNDNGKHRSVHAFLEVATGNIYKPASWNKPAKHIRYNIFDRNFLQNVTDPHGGYLYIKR